MTAYREMDLIERVNQLEDRVAKLEAPNLDRSLNALLEETDLYEIENYRKLLKGTRDERFIDVYNRHIRRIVERIQKRVAGEHD